MHFAKTIIPTKLELFGEVAGGRRHNFVAGHILLNPKANKLFRKQTPGFQ